MYAIYSLLLFFWFIQKKFLIKCVIGDSLSRRQGVQMASFIFLLMCVMASCCVPIVVSMVPVVYNVHHPQCGETQYNSTQQLTDILEQVSSY